MRIFHYPDYESHKAEHEELIAEVADLQHKVASGKTACTYGMRRILGGDFSIIMRFPFSC